MFAGIDGAVHLAEEVTDATRTVPRALFSTIIIGFVTAFPFAVAMLYTINDFDKVLEDLTGYEKTPDNLSGTDSNIAQCAHLRDLVPSHAFRCCCNHLRRRSSLHCHLRA